jgi:hypothetical protein
MSISGLDSTALGLRFAVRVAPPTQDSLTAAGQLCRAGFVNPQGRDERFLCSSHFLLSRAFPDAKTPTNSLRIQESPKSPGSWLKAWRRWMSESRRRWMSESL